MQVCSREDEVAARRRVVDAWKAQGKSDAEIAALLDCKLLQRQAEALERRINQRTADAGLALEDLEVGGGGVRLAALPFTRRIMSAHCLTFAGLCLLNPAPAPACPASPLAPSERALQGAEQAVEAGLQLGPL